MLHLQKYVFPRRDQTFTNPRRPDFVARTPRGRRTDSTVEAGASRSTLRLPTGRTLCWLSPLLWPA